MTRACFVVVATALLILPMGADATSPYGGHQGTSEQRRACRPDVLRVAGSMMTALSSSASERLGRNRSRLAVGFSKVDRQLGCALNGRNVRRDFVQHSPRAPREL
jgi:hypothetical protein